MTPETLSELKSLLEKATPPCPRLYPYHAFDYCIYWDPGNVLAYTGGTNEGPIAQFEKATDAKLWCAFRNSSPDLIKAVEQRDRYRKWLEKISKIIRHSFLYSEPTTGAKMAIEALKDTKEETRT